MATADLGERHVAPHVIIRLWRHGHEPGRVSDALGALTQLVECDLCKVEVRGSSPLCSTAELPSQTPLTREFVMLLPDSRGLKGTTEDLEMERSWNALHRISVGF